MQFENGIVFEFQRLAEAAIDNVLVDQERRRRGVRSKDVDLHRAFGGVGIVLKLNRVMGWVIRQGRQPQCWALEVDERL